MNTLHLSTCMLPVEHTHTSSRACACFVTLFVYPPVNPDWGIKFPSNCVVNNMKFSYLSFPVSVDHSLSLYIYIYIYIYIHKQISASNYNNHLIISMYKKKKKLEMQIADLVLRHVQISNLNIYRNYKVFTTARYPNTNLEIQVEGCEWLKFCSLSTSRLHTERFLCVL